jgi:serine/threonine protein kinase
MAGSNTPNADFSALNKTPSGQVVGSSLRCTSDSATGPSFQNGSSLVVGGPSGLLESFDPAADVFGRLKAGDIVGERYRVQSLVGYGGMGMVYKVEQIFLGKELALKILHGRSATDVTVRRFQHEARAAFGIDHPNLISVHDFGLLDQRVPFLVMDYVRGQSLAHLVEKCGTLTVDEAVPIFLRICFGLGYAHERGVIHRDMKPSNIMLVDGMSASDEGRVKIVDFGIAKFTQLEASEIQALTRTGEVFGSPLYMSPEQCSGSPVDQRADIYSLGCVFFEVLTGTTPFVGANALSTMMQHMGETPPSLKEASMGKDFPPVLEQIIAKMLAKRAKERYQNLGQVAVDLAAVERTLADPVLLANTVLVDQQPKQNKQVKQINQPGVENGMVSVSRPFLYLMTALVVAISASASSLITVHLNAKKADDQPLAAPVAAKKRTYPDLKLIHVDEAKQFVKTLENKSPKPEEAKDTILKLLKVEEKSGKMQMRFIFVSELALRAIARTKWIRHLDMTGCDIDNPNLIMLTRLPQLKHVTFTSSELDDIGAAAISKCTTINDISASWCERLTDKAIPYFTIMPSLKKLEISGTTLTPLSIRFLADDERLQYLDLRAVTGVDDESFAPMVDSKLLFLNVESTHIEDKAAKYFSKMRNLLSIAVGGTNMSARGIEALLENKKLRTIMYTLTPYLQRQDIQLLKMKHPEVRFLEGFQKGDATGL